MDPPPPRRAGWAGSSLSELCICIARSVVMGQAAPGPELSVLIHNVLPLCEVLCVAVAAAQGEHLLLYSVIEGGAAAEGRLTAEAKCTAGTAVWAAYQTGQQYLLRPNSARPVIYDDWRVLRHKYGVEHIVTAPLETDEGLLGAVTLGSSHAEAIDLERFQTVSQLLGQCLMHVKCKQDLQMAIDMLQRVGSAANRFLAWHNAGCAKSDIVFSTIGLIVVSTISCLKPYALALRYPWLWPFSFTIMVPLLWRSISTAGYLRNRERIQASVFAFLGLFTILVFTETFLAVVEPDKRTSLPWLLRITACEYMAVAALGLLVRFHVYLPIQLVLFAGALANMPRTCQVLYPYNTWPLCLPALALLVSVVGFMAPTALIWLNERRSRRAFAARCLSQ
ncbi:hypothetical protein WJX72_002559 [[Myrmecia] bisecta]|uniref:GAF domain-containing protein n=1 Tax=[Myrmecia] bisecta TaxID=41462 RepID=A0AAW1PAQ0_9CHLO